MAWPRRSPTLAMMVLFLLAPCFPLQSESLAEDAEGGIGVAGCASSEQDVLTWRGRSLLQGIPEVRFSRKPTVEDALLQTGLAEAGTSKRTVVTHAIVAAGEHRQLPNRRDALQDMRDDGVAVVSNGNMTHGGHVDAFAAGTVAASCWSSSVPLLLAEVPTRMKRVLLEAGVGLRGTVGTSSWHVLLGLGILFVVIVMLIFLGPAFFADRDKDFSHSHSHMHRRSVPIHATGDASDAYDSYDSFAAYDGGVHGRYQSSPLPSRPQIRSPVLSNTQLYPPSPLPTHDDVVESIETYLCPGLVVPAGNECVLALPTLSASSCDVRDSEGKTLLKAEVTPPVWDAQGSDLPLVVLRAAPLSHRMPEISGPGQLLAYCKVGPVLEGRRAVCVYNNRDELFAHITKVTPVNQVQTARQRGPQSCYVLTRSRTRLRVHFDGNFAVHSVSITNERKEYMAHTEPVKMAWATKGAYYQLTVSSNVDVGLVVCSLLAIDQMAAS